MSKPRAYYFFGPLTQHNCQALRNRDSVLIIGLKEDIDFNDDALSCEFQTRTGESSTGKYFLAVGSNLNENDIIELCENPEYSACQMWFHPLGSCIEDLEAYQPEKILKAIKDIQAGGQPATAAEIELIGMTSNGTGLYWNSPRSTEPEVLPGIKSSCDENGLQLISA